MTKEQELLLLLRKYNLPACSVGEDIQVDKTRRNFLSEAEPLIRKDERERICREFESKELLEVGRKAIEDVLVEIFQLQ